MLGVEDLVAELRKMLRHSLAESAVVILHPEKLASDTKAARHMASRASRLLDALDPYSLRVGVELTGDLRDDSIFLESLFDQWSSLHGADDVRLGLVPDSEHQAHRGGSAAATLKRFGEKACLLHLKDYDGLPFDSLGHRRFVRPWQGDLSIDQLASLAELYSVPIVLEGVYACVSDLVSDICRIREVIGGRKY